jgi:serine phosphatase RsbU (regulator of sigma subunit)
MITQKEKDIINILKNIPIFQGLDEADYREIIPLLKQEAYAAGARIIKEGTRGDSMCIIIRGAVAITKTDKTNEEILLEVLYSESYFGEFSLVDNMPRSANVTAAEETELFRLEKKDFDFLLSKNGSISAAFYKNCLEETFSRFRNIISSFTFSQHNLKKKSSLLDEINRDLSHARQIQDYLINRDLLDHERSFLPGVRHSYIYKPCIEIGGDFLNVTLLKKGVASIIIADIMGHGITSALGTGVLKSAYSLAVKGLGQHPARLMKFLNRHYLGVITNLYATCYYALIDMNKKKVGFAKAGHPHPLFWKRSMNGFKEIRCQGTGLGLVKKGEFGQVQYSIQEGDKMLFFTDGIIEQKNMAGEMYTESRLQRVFRELIGKDEPDVLKRLHDDLAAFAGEKPMGDDITLLLLEF